MSDKKRTKASKKTMATKVHSVVVDVSDIDAQDNAIYECITNGWTHYESIVIPGLSMLLRFEK